MEQVITAIEQAITAIRVMHGIVTATALDQARRATRKAASRRKHEQTMIRLRALAVKGSPSKRSATAITVDPKRARSCQIKAICRPWGFGRCDGHHQSAWQCVLCAIKLQ